jgi:hypothetical protein
LTSGRIPAVLQIAVNESKEQVAAALTINPDSVKEMYMVR